MLRPAWGLDEIKSLSQRERRYWMEEGQWQKLNSPDRANSIATMQAMANQQAALNHVAKTISRIAK